MRNINVNDTIDRAGFNRFFLTVFLLLFSSQLLAGYGIGSYSVTLTSIQAELGFADAQVGFLASAALFGMVIGALVLGFSSDRLGRKKLIVVGITILSIFNGLIIVVDGMTSFLLLRFIAGFGIGAMTPLCVSLMSEYSPAAKRTFLITLMMTGVPFGQFLASLSGTLLLESVGWRAVYVASFAGLALVPFLVLLLPDSMKSYVERGDVTRITYLLERIAPKLAPSDDDHYVLDAENRQKALPRTLFSRTYVRNTLVICLMFFCNLYVFYGVSTWLPGLMAIQGHELRSSLMFLSVFLLGNLLAAPVAGLCADRFGYKRVMGIFYVTLVIAIVLLSVGTGGFTPYVLVFIAGGSVGTAHNMTLAITPRFYPLSLRGTAIGLGSACSRVGSAIAPTLVGVMLSFGTQANVIFLTFAVPALLGLVAVMSTRSRG
ncbi:MAG: MFS transporter [Coriobacteriia bacterium]|nr:MFS transporter [Coriobacteriia bacterium]